MLVTLNPLHEPRDVEAEFTYHHPTFDRAAVDAQRELPSIQGRDRTWFAGSYCGHGFHEDGLTAGLEVAAALGAPAPWRVAPQRLGAERRARGRGGVGTHRGHDRATARASTGPAPEPWSLASGLYVSRVMHERFFPSGIGSRTGCGTCSPTWRSSLGSTARSRASRTTARRS